MRPLLNACFGPAKAAQFQLVCTECNSVSDLPGKQSVSIVDALFYADAFGMMLHSEFKAMTWFCARGGTQMWWNNPPTLYGWRHYGDYGMLATHDPNNPTFTPPGGDEDTPYPTYFALKLITQFAHPGDAVIAASSDNPLLTVYACRRPGHLTLLLVNKSQNSDADATCSLSGVQVTGVGRTLEYGKVQDFAQEHGAAVDLVEGSAVVTGHTVEVNVPAYTVAVIDVP